MADPPLTDPPDRPDHDAALVTALARGLSRKQAAHEAGVSERTVYRRMECSSFRQAVQRARTDLLDSAVGRLAGAAAGAVSVLMSLAMKGESEQTRLGAARAILATLLPLREQTDLLVRLEALETRINEQSRNATRQAGSPHGGIGR